MIFFAITLEGLQSEDPPLVFKILEAVGIEERRDADLGVSGGRGSGACSPSLCSPLLQVLPLQLHLFLNIVLRYFGKCVAAARSNYSVEPLLGGLLYVLAEAVQDKFGGIGVVHRRESVLFAFWLLFGAVEKTL